MQPGHRVGVDVLAVPKGVTAVSALDFESEFAVEPQGRLIVGVISQCRVSDMEAHFICIPRKGDLLDWRQPAADWLSRGGIL